MIAIMEELQESASSSTRIFNLKILNACQPEPVSGSDFVSMLKKDSEINLSAVR
jgi:hypothetical protein